MNKHAPDSCPRCGNIFTCKANNVNQCDCQNANLTFDETQYIREITVWGFEGACLCVACLRELQQEFHSKKLLT